MLPLRRLHVRKYLPISMNTETSTQSSNTDTNRPQRLDEKCISASELQFRKRNKPETDSRLGDAIAVSIIVYESSNFLQDNWVNAMKVKSENIPRNRRRLVVPL